MILFRKPRTSKQVANSEEEGDEDDTHGDDDDDDIGHGNMPSDSQGSEAQGDRSSGLRPDVGVAKATFKLSSGGN